MTEIESTTEGTPLGTIEPIPVERIKSVEKALKDVTASLDRLTKELKKQR